MSTPRDVQARRPSPELPNEIEPAVDPTTHRAGPARTVAAIALSAGAFTLLLRVFATSSTPGLGDEATPAPAAVEARASAPVETTPPAPAAIVRTPGAGVAPAVPHTASTATPVSAASDESRGASGPDTPSPDGDEAALVVVPDFTTLRVPQARRAARAVGLRLIVRDDFGDPIEASFSPGYRVRSQQVPAGRAVPRGTEVRALAEAPAPIVSGY